MLYVNNNETIVPADDFAVGANSRAYLYGDGVFESIRIRNGVPLNIENHVNRLVQGAKALKMRVPIYFTPDFFEIRIRELCKKSEIRDGGKCRLSLDRISGGTYSPISNDVTFFIEVGPLEENEFQLNLKGLEVDLFTDLKKNFSPISQFKTKNALVSVLGAIKAQEKQLDDMLLTNDKSQILESTNSNLFVVSNGILYTPPVADGCLAGTMRMQIINLAIKNGVRVYESSIVPSNLLIADEIFLTNAVKGIVWVGGYRTKRYFNSVAKRFIQMLNDHSQMEIENKLL